MGRRLAANVALRDPNTYQPVTFVAGSVPPAWAADLITNAKAWTSDADHGDVAFELIAEPPANGSSAAVTVDRPPKGGDGSDLRHWATHAESLGIDVPENATRGDVITLVEAFEDAQPKN